MDATEWIETYADRLGVAPPEPDEVERLLEIAAVAAHASERLAAPVACWLTARAGLPPEQALALARGVAPE